MTDFAALRCTHAANLTRAIRREVVLMHVALTLFRPDGVEALPFIEHTERTNGKRLGLTALEEHDHSRARLLGFLLKHHQAIDERIVVGLVFFFGKLWLVGYDRLEHCHW